MTFGYSRRGATFAQGARRVLGLGLLLGLAPTAVLAADPATGTLSPTTTEILKWTDTATGTGALDAAAWVEGVTVDTYKLTITGTPADWNNKSVKVLVTWTNPANDYDVYLYKGGVQVGSDGSGVPATSEAVVINPGTMGVGEFEIKIGHYANTPQIDQPRGAAWVSGVSPVYLKGGLTFSQNTTVRAPAASADGEPSSRCDFLGNYYVGGIRGIPAGIDLWWFDLRPGSPTYDPFLRNPDYLGQPDSFTQQEAVAVGADGGGDIDIAVGFKKSGPNQVPTVAITSLALANISSARSIDGGQTFNLNPLGNVTGGIPGDDRQWQEFYGENVVYLFYRTLQPAVSMVQRSNDGGLTWGPARTAGLIGQAGGIDVDQNDGTVYISGSSGKVAVGVPATPGAEPLTYTVYTVGGSANLFFTVKVADDGTVYVCYSDLKNIYIKYSKDKGQTWSAPIRVNDGPETRTSLLPWMETGPVPGSIGVVWYGTSSTANNGSSAWKVFFAQGFNANTSTPTFRQVVVSDHYNHYGNLSLNGLDPTGEGANRNLLDYFQVSFDPVGAACIAWTGDHNDFNGHTFVARQISGENIRGEKMPAQVEGANLPPRGAYSTDGSQVIDFERDVTVGLLGLLPTQSPADILSIKYSNETKAGGEPVIVAAMKVSAIQTNAPANGSWRMNFTVNAPIPNLRPNQDFTTGVSDAGDQFYVIARTDAQGVMTAKFGTAVRNADGSLTYTDRGDADSFAVNAQSRTFTVKVSASKLTPFLKPGGAPIAAGSVLCGLRGVASVANANALRDDTRGGTIYRVK